MTGHSDEFSVDVDLLAQHASSFNWLADRVAGIHAELGRALDDTDGCWGNDTVGRSFADSHVAAAQATLDGLGGLPDKLSDVGRRLAKTATAYRTTDAEQATRFFTGEG
ncbi:MAG: WXG100 family type VII secretion target [Sciscionella sp.]